ncbi:MAG: hypothetical protein ACREP9_00915 [Candidatus Dormibacteraceae bacterium]
MEMLLVCPDHGSPNRDSEEPDTPAVPQAHNNPDSTPDTGSDQEIFRYVQTSKRGRSRTFTGHVTYVGGAEGERLRRELAAVTRDLLEWARSRSNDAEPSGGGDTASGPDSVKGP